MSIILNVNIPTNFLCGIVSTSLITKMWIGMGRGSSFDQRVELVGGIGLVSCILHCPTGDTLAFVVKDMSNHKVLQIGGE